MEWNEMVVQFDEADKKFAIFQNEYLKNFT